MRLPDRRAVPPAPPRDTRLDLVRGWLQITIFASHATGSWIGVWLIHAAWGLSDSSEQFVFLSGFTLGSVFARNAARAGWGAATRDMLRRTWRLYRTQLLIFALFAALILTVRPALPGEAGRLGWDWLARDPARAVPAGLAMLYQPADMGILPVFICCMLALPGFLWLLARLGDAALLAPAALYAAVWLAGLHVPPLGPDTGIGFDPLAWQALFLSGAWLGRRTLLGQRLPRPLWATALAALVLAAGLLLRLVWYGWTPWPAGFAPTLFGIFLAKTELGPPRAVHALALAWLVAALVPRDAAWMYRPALSWLAPVGRHSLQVFCLGLFLSWAASLALRLTPGRWWLDPLAIGLGALAMAGYARWLEARRELRRTVPAAA